jgi:hypothetical protein
MTNTIRLILVATFLSGCAPSLAKVSAEPPSREVGATPDADHCQKLSRAESALRYVVAGSAAAAAGSGLGAIPVDDRDAQRALAISAAGLGATAAISEAVRAQLAADYARECE